MKDHTDMIHCQQYLLNFSKVFDTVSHQHLYYKLHHYGIRGNLLEWLKHFLSGRHQWVIVNVDPVDVASGIQQDTVLAPLLFL